MTDKKHMTDKQGRPIACTFSYKIPGFDTVYQYLPLCPFCGGSHRHGYGFSENDNGVRAAHCGRSGKQEYHLVCIGPMTEQVRRHYDSRYT